MMDLSAQQKRRPAATYGKFFGNRRAVSTAFEAGIDLPRYEEESVSPGRVESPSLELARPVPSTSKQPSTSGGKNVSHHKNNKHGLERANSTSKLEIADQTVFDVPSSDEDIPKLKPTVRRALSSSQKKLGKSRLEENRTPSTGGCGRYPGDKEGFKAQRPMVALGQTAAKTQSKVIKRTLTGRSEGRFAGDNNVLSLKTLISEPKITSRILGPAHTPLGQSSAEVTGRVAQNVTGEKANLEESKALAKIKADEALKVEQNGLAVSMPKSQEGPVAKKTSAQVDVPVQQRRPRKYRDPKPTQITSEREPTIERKTSLLTRPKDPSGAIGSRKALTGLLSTSHMDIGPLYIPSPVVEIEKPQKGDVASSTGDTKFTEETTLWDDIMGGIEEEHWFPRKPKRSRDPEGSEEVLEKGPTPPRRRRLIDSLEVDQNIDQPKQGVEEEMDVDVDSQTSDHIPLLHSQLSLDLQENDDLEDAAQTFQRGVGAMQNAPVYPHRNTRVTYARQRSFLTEEDKAGGDPFADPLLLPVRDLGRGSRKVPIVEEDDEDTTPGMMKSLHELREAGVNTRFLDSVEGYFEDIERGVSLGQKRVGYIELATKLCDRTFLQKFRANNFERRLLKDLGKQDDEIVRFVLSFIVWTLLEGETPPQILQVIHKRGILPLLDKMLVSNRDMKFVVKDKKINMTRAAQSLLLEFCDVIKGSKIFGGKAPKSLSPQILALAVLDSVLKSLRRAGFMGPCLSIPILQKLVKVLEPFQDSVDIEKRKQVDPLFVELPVSILESHSIGNEDVLIPREELEILANIIPGVMQLEGDGFKPIQLLILRLHINLTNRRPDICGIFGKSTVISTVVAKTQSTFHALSGSLGEEDRLIQLDMLVLSLALMINFAEMSDSARSSFVEGSFEDSQLSILLNLFLGRMERAAEAESMEESQSNVAFGYLSILLGNLCQNHTVRNVLRSKMPKGSLQPLMFAVQEFVSHNQKVDEERRQITGGEGENWHRGFTERLEEVAARLRALEDKT